MIASASGHHDFCDSSNFYPENRSGQDRNIVIYAKMCGVTRALERSEISPSHQDRKCQNLLNFGCLITNKHLVSQSKQAFDSQKGERYHKLYFSHINL